jgi:hypothetical protein
VEEMRGANATSVDGKRGHIKARVQLGLEWGLLFRAVSGSHVAVDGILHVLQVAGLRGKEGAYEDSLGGHAGLGYVGPTQQADLKGGPLGRYGSHSSSLLRESGIDASPGVVGEGHPQQPGRRLIRRLQAIPSRSMAGRERRVHRGVHRARNMHEDTLGDRLADATGPGEKVVGVADGGQVSVWVSGGVLDVVSILHGGRARGPTRHGDGGEATLAAEAIQVGHEGLEDDGPLLAADRGSLSQGVSHREGLRQEAVEANARRRSLQQHADPADDPA